MAGLWDYFGGGPNPAPAPGLFDPSIPAMPTAPLQPYLTGGALGQAGLPIGGAQGYTGDVLQHLKDVISGKVAAGGALGQNNYDPQASFAQNALNPAALAQATDVVMGVGPGAIRAYHGSPHDFLPEPGYPLGRFDPNRIGTGEGAQAYGHGMPYLAEAEDVARSYRDTLSRANSIAGGVSDRVAELGGKIADLDYSLKGVAQGSAEARTLNQQIRAIEQERRVLMDQMRGHMYEVDIHAEPGQFLNWDRSLAGQSPEVQAALQQKLGQPAGLPPGYRLIRQTGSGDYMVADDLGMGATGKGGIVARGRTPEDALRLYLPTGGEFYQGLAQKLGGTREQVTPAGSYDIPYSNDALASAQLKEAGIPGIRYLDQGSRGAKYQVTTNNPDFPSPAFYTMEEAQKRADYARQRGFVPEIKELPGTSNYAMFDPSIVEILRKYGILLPLAGAGALGFSQNQ